MSPDLAAADSRRLRLLIVCTSLSRGGAERNVANLAKRMDRRRFTIDLALMRPDIDYPVPSDVTLHDLGKRRLWHNLRAIWRLRRLLQSGDFDVVLSALSTTNDLVLLAGARIAKRPPWIARIDGDPLQLGLTEPARFKRAVKLYLQRRVFQQADALLLNSRGSRDSLGTMVPSCLGKSRVIYNILDLDEISAQALQPSVLGADRHEGITLITVARLEPLKGIQLVLRAVATLAQQGLDLRYVVCGSGSQSESLQAMVTELGIGHRVRFTGFVSNPYAELARADIYVLASEREGLPNALIEAQVLGIPAVATDCRSGPAEVLADGETGLLVPVGDQQAITAAIRALAINRALRKQYGAAAAERARTLFYPEARLRELEQFISQTGRPRCGT